jgi:hypothetical protein
MAYLKPPTTAELKGMAQLQRAELAKGWRAIAQHLAQHREHLKLCGWETYAINKAGKIAAQQAHDELATMLRGFFAIAGENIGLAQHDYEQKRQKDK